jgi:hypothetical protein
MESFGRLPRVLPIAICGIFILAEACNSSGGGTPAGSAGRGGTTGAAGTHGQAGTTGASGTTGSAGISGIAGTTGSAGTSDVGGTGGSLGSAGISGSTGSGGAAAGFGGPSAGGVGGEAGGTGGRSGTGGGNTDAGAADVVVRDASVDDAGAYMRTGWIATGMPESLPPAMRNPASSDNLDAKNAIDGNPKTRWSTGLHQVGNETFTLDFGETISFSKVVLLAGQPGGQDPNDVPNAYSVYVSADGMNWGQPVLMGKGMTPASGQPGLTTIMFPMPQAARYLRIAQTGHTGSTTDPKVFGAYWAICEITVYP